MAMTPEKKVKAKVVTLLKNHGAYYYTPVTAGYGTSGLFDIAVCYMGRYIGIECKATPKNKPTVLQERNAIKARSAGAVVMLIHCDNTDLVSNLLNKLQNGQFINESYWDLPD